MIENFVTCKDCSIVLTEENAPARKKTGLVCQSCVAKRAKAYRAANPDKVKASKKAYYQPCNIRKNNRGILVMLPKLQLSL